MLCYLAGPIDHVSHDEATGWREAAAGRLNLAGIGTFSPVGAFSLPTGARAPALCDKVIDLNESALVRSDVVLVNLDGKSFGTPIECGIAFARGVPAYGFGVEDNIDRSIYKHLFKQVEKGMHSVIDALIKDCHGGNLAKALGYTVDSAGTGATMVDPS